MSRYNVEPLDEYMKLQEVTNDHQIRFVIQFEQHLDIERFISSIKESIKIIPILGSKYVYAGDKVFWQDIEYSDDEIYRISNGNITESNIAEYLIKKPKDEGPQILFQIVHQDTGHVIIVTVNHMAFDASGFKEYLYLLSEIYSGFNSVEKDYSKNINTDRRIGTLLKNIPIWQKFYSLFRKTLNTKGIGIFTGSIEDIKTRLKILKISPENFLRIKDICANKDITINDLFLAFFCHSLFSITHCNKDDGLTMQVMFDLRRYVKKFNISQFGNFSSMESVFIRNKNHSENNNI